LSHSTRSSPVSGLFVATPRAAAPLIAILVERFHGPGSREETPCGSGWDVSDDPIWSAGLAGGAFDDVGFDANKRILAADGVWVGRIGGWGTFRRASYREPPVESATNLIVSPGENGELPKGAAIVRRCRVLRTSPELWVLELEFEIAGTASSPERRWVRVSPKALLAACSSRFGDSRLTSEGPVVPALAFEGLLETK
jgi:hypothetical protein